MSSGGTTTSTTNTDPWSAQQPYLQSVFDQAQKAYNLYGANPASSVAGFTPYQQAAFSQTADAAGGTPGQNIAGLNNSATGFNQDLLSGSYLSGNPTNASLNNIVAGGNPVSQSLAQLGTGQGLANNAYSAFASGNMLNNPYMQQTAAALTDPIVRAYQTATAPQTSSAFEAAGRYGSGAMMNAQSQNEQNLATQLGNTLSPLYSNMYQTNLGNMLQGAQGLSSNILGGSTNSLNSVLSALGQQGGNYTSGVNQMIQGLSQAPGTAGMNQNAIANLGNAGAQGQTLNQSILNAPNNLANQLANLIRGNYGSTGTSTEPYFTNTGAGILGGSLLGSQLGTNTGIGSGTGAALGGLLSLLQSDRRVKTDIEPVGKLDNGLTVYRYRYKSGGPMHLGVMADEAKVVRPQAVANINGLDYVDYGAL
jgi:hypothetical protein